MNRFRKFFALPFQDKKLLIQSLFLVAAIRMSLWVFPFRWVNKWASRLELPENDGERLDWIAINGIVHSVRTSSGYVPSATCLTQALATQALLRIKGQGSRVRIGVDKDESAGLMAHAWVEVSGRIIIGEERGHARFLVLKPSDQAIL